jgi:glucokinase
MLGAKRKSPACAAALDLFASLYGAEAGNLALKYLAVGGVFLAGKIAASLAPTLKRVMLPSFRDKGRMRPLMERMPVAIVKSSSVGLHGAARYAAARG